jgi:CrcB protein
MSQNLIQIIFVAVAGAAGALSRWGIGRLMVRLLGTGFPYGTLIVNILGCFLIGLIMQVGLTTTRISETARIALTVGFLGALTTFSSFSYETLALAEQGRWLGVCSNIALNVILSLFATLAGLAVAKTLCGGAA